MKRILNILVLVLLLSTSCRKEHTEFPSTKARVKFNSKLVDLDTRANVIAGTGVMVVGFLRTDSLIAASTTATPNILKEYSIDGTGAMIPKADGDLLINTFGTYDFYAYCYEGVPNSPPYQVGTINVTNITHTDNMLVAKSLKNYVGINSNLVIDFGSMLRMHTKLIINVIATSNSITSVNITNVVIERFALAPATFALDTVEMKLVSPGTATMSLTGFTPANSINQSLTTLMLPIDLSATTYRITLYTTLNGSQMRNFVANQVAGIDFKAGYAYTLNLNIEDYLFSVAPWTQIAWSANVGDNNILP